MFDENKVARDAAELKRKQMSCDHDWQKTDNWLIDRCAKCGEERA